MSVSEGFCAPGYETVRDQLDQSLLSGDDLGASVTLHHRGEIVVDLFGGYFDAQRAQPWTKDTLVNVWSSTKTMTFLVALLLLDRGELDFDAPVAKYWPEFAANGKGDVLVRHVLSHTSGVPGWSEQLLPEDLADWEKCVTSLARQEPWFAAGTQGVYHALTQGYLLGEIFQRITGMSFGNILRTEFAEPLGADFHVGLSDRDLARVSPVIPLAPYDFSTMDPASYFVRTLNSPPLNSQMANEAWWRSAEIPAANGHGNSHSVALLQSIVANGGEAGGKRFIRSETLERIFVTEYEGFLSVLEMDFRIGAGYGLSSATTPFGPRAAFWGGNGGSLVLIDLATQTTFTYMMNKMAVGLVGDIRGVMLALASFAAAALN